MCNALRDFKHLTPQNKDVISENKNFTPSNLFKNNATINKKGSDGAALCGCGMVYFRVRLRQKTNNGRDKKREKITALFAV